MKFQISQADHGYVANMPEGDEIEINTLEELLALIDSVDEDVVIGQNKYQEGKPWTIIVYNGPLE